MTTMRRLAYAVFGVACTHLVFGAIVRISGSGMGCGPHWPKCYGSWFPPMSRPDLVIEVTHRYLASILLLSLIGLLVMAFRRRAEPGIGGQGGVLRMAALATALGFGAALLGAVTVKLGNSAPATVAHWTVAMSLVAAVTATVIRAGGLGGAAALLGGASAKTRRGTLAGAGLALAAVVMGGLTAKVQGGPIACLAFPLCGANPAVPQGAVHVQSTHRVIAVLLVLHLVGLFFGLRKRRAAPVVRRAVAIALGLGVLQLLIAGAMIGMHLPPALRSLHEATGVSIWIAAFTLAYLARIASREPDADHATDRTPTPPAAPLDPDTRTSASIRVAGAARPVLATAAPSVPDGATMPDVTPSSTMEGATTTYRTPVAPTLVVPSLATVYRPTAAEVMVVDVAPVLASLAPTMPRRVAGAIELPAATRHAMPAAIVSALDFHRIGAMGAMQAAALEERAAHESELALELAESPLASAVADVSEIDYADIVDVEMLEVLGDAGVEPASERVVDHVVAIDVVVSDVVTSDAVTDSVESLEPVGIEAVATDAPALDAVVVAALAAEASTVERATTGTPVMDASADEASTDVLADVVSTLDLPAVVVSTAEVTAVGPSVMAAVAVDVDAGSVVDAGIVVDAPAPAAARGAPPTEESTGGTTDDHDHPVPRRTIFDPAADADDAIADDVDDLYNLRQLAHDDDTDDDGERVATLDEEFSTLATALEALGAFDVESQVEHVAALAAAVVVPVARPRDTLASLFALRRPMMTHSVAVIAARGADL